MENTYNKIIEIDEAMKHFRDGMIIMFGGFGGIGTPPALIDGILDNGFKDLTLIGNDSGFPHIGIGKVVSQGRAKKMIASHIGSNPVAGQLMTDGKMEVEFSPQGILAERIRAGGVGIPAILSDIGLDNDIVTSNKQTCNLSGKKYLVETALTAEISIVFAKKADPYGNLIYDKSARNTNPLVAMAGDMTIAEVEEIVPLGSLDPDEIITPGVFVDYIVPSKGVNWKWAWE
ncbi:MULTISPECIES: CoA transferase subunit A [Cytobacillus]|jgi:acetate CoA/acetoacetate CoA-transferase alpha subunit|uniref:Acyl CoA:acetate/3-ketoacid CoA transferase subunit alpha n=3 Tax=Cytobacillus TaxID=2675230 RepID=A0A160ME35_9BACI|nr:MULTISPECIES: CoA transferase subunit A [Cytobacillus]EFV77830.1 aetate CoA-transferase [Bacillus sp. 2_A_57_CT2]MBY0154893.1 CoA transferase subunit A [Cytobacillus firmus]AND41094.1 acyl CoA:acetate/3-ketoacid CoA transferase subunit alpha [Cytobacillus oceanisediminis 2691]MBU8731584.1 CoA transferase subunit A [Cytobacillus oceanisediminis]MCM3243449.1 CoA transferase subunit A [Cytobacillus oceanisediminis]